MKKFKIKHFMFLMMGICMINPIYANSDYRNEKFSLVSEHIEYLISRVNDINLQHGIDHNGVILDYKAIIYDLKKIKSGIDDLISLQLDSVRVHQPVMGEYSCKR